MKDRDDAVVQKLQSIQKYVTTKDVALGVGEDGKAGSGGGRGDEGGGRTD